MLGGSARSRKSLLIGAPVRYQSLARIRKAVWSYKFPRPRERSAACSNVVSVAYVVYQRKNGSGVETRVSVVRRLGELC